jgi:hypothetical protein
MSSTSCTFRDPALRQQRVAPSTFTARSTSLIPGEPQRVR